MVAIWPFSLSSPTVRIYVILPIVCLGTLVRIRVLIFWGLSVLVHLLMLSYFQVLIPPYPWMRSCENAIGVSWSAGKRTWSSTFLRLVGWINLL